MEGAPPEVSASLAVVEGSRLVVRPPGRGGLQAAGSLPLTVGKRSAVGRRLADGFADAGRCVGAASPSR